MNFCMCRKMECHNFEDVKFVVQACVNSKKDGIPLEKLDTEFLHFYGAPIPYRYFGFSSLKSYLHSLPDIYMEGENVILCSAKSRHITKLVQSEKFDGFLPNSQDVLCESVLSAEDFSKLENILPLFYKHQAMGDDFFLDIADTYFGCYVPPNGLLQYGLCVHNQTIKDLIKRVDSSKYLAPKAAVMIGIADILKGRNIRSITRDLRALVRILKSKKIDVTLFTIIKPSTKYFSAYEKKRLRIYNNSILKYQYDPRLSCKVVDINKIFTKAHLKLNEALPRNDVFQILTKTEKKTFFKVLRKYLTQNL